MLGVVVWIVLGATLCQDVGNARWPGVVMQPQLAQRNPGDSVVVLCQTPLPAHACQFKVKVETEFNETELALMDFGLGLASVPHPMANGTASYHGTGLESGQCGMTLTGLTAGRYFVGCRVRSGDSGWMYDFMALVVHTQPINPIIEVNKTLASFPLDVVDRRHPLPIVWFPEPSGQSMNTCKFYLPHQREPVQLDATTTSTITKPEHQVILEGNRCGVQLQAATNLSNGLVWCLYRAGAVADFRLFAPRVVAVREPPHASLNATPGNLTIGDEFTATCVAASSRPPARISWTLDGRTIRDDALDEDAISRPWVWPWNVRSVKQVLRLVLSRDDLGKRVACRVSQPGVEDVKLEALVNWDSSVCIDGVMMCNWALILTVTAVVIAVIAAIAAIVVMRNRRDWRWT